MKKLFYFAFILQFIIPLQIQAQWFGKATEKHLIPSESLVYDDIDINRENPVEGLRYNKYGHWTDDYWIMDTGKRHHILEHDYSKGYPILLNDYKYSENEEGIGAPKYELRTILNEAGIRTSFINTNRPTDIFTFDEAGHLLTCSNNNDRTETLTWNGDIPTSYKYDFISEGQGDELHILLNEINIINTDRPFNAYQTDYFYLYNEPTSSFTAINAKGTYYSKRQGNIQEGILTITSVLDENGKDFTTTHRIGDEIQSIKKVIYADEFGSFIFRTISPTNPKQYWETAYLYNEYGDYVQKTERAGNNLGVIKEEIKELLEWKYDDDGKPLEVTRSREYTAGIPLYHRTEVFTAWHEPSTMNEINRTGEITLLNGNLYSINGTLVRTVSAEEIRTNNIHIPQKGIYLLIINTNQGMQTRKVVITE